jgi:uncharacterized membrane protein
MSTPEPHSEGRQADPDTTVTLRRRIRQICRRIVIGKAAINRWEVKFQQALRVVSIILSSLGSAGVIADKVTDPLPGGTGSAFWISVSVLVFGIVIQIATAFRIEQTANDARAVAEACIVFEAQLGIMLEEENPVSGVERLRTELNTVILKYTRVLPRAAPALLAETDALSAELIQENEEGWRIPASRPIRRAPKRKPTQGGSEPPGDPATGNR